jgi:predicted PurR-regulated permease PerM
MKRIEVIASIVVVSLIILGGLLVLRPFITAILWAGILTFSTWRGFQWLLDRLKGRRGLAAGIMTFLISVVLVVPFVVVGVTLANNVSRIGEWFTVLEAGIPREIPEELANAPLVGPLLEKSWSHLVLEAEDGMNILKDNAMASGKWFLSHAIGFSVGIAQLVLSLLVAFLFYCEGDRMVDRIETGGRRILGDSIQQHLTIVGKTIKSVVYGIIGTAMIQGILAGFGFWLAGVPSPVLLGLVTIAVSSVPMGPPLIWIPCAVWLYMNGAVGWAVFMALWGLIAITGLEHVIRPYFIMQGTNLPFVVILFGVIGGVVAFGFIGLFLGPVLLAVGYRLVREFTEKVSTVKKSAAEATGSVGKIG